ncbi:MAG TPA: hypothetical protein PKX79_09895 [Spirochaetota bacterium]|jgi:hypothetical protein|nr:hypothetical protein [Spirochaetota bacterium]OQB00394.1 MAG: hypothetical protein BWY23_00211 [Spirochaetes bacterium ADurb.Bin218]HRT84549.1 hypothetical protein [Bacteroidales bacterium]HOK02239.1 hypothetical protein [Spirochaetota bacterium]HOK93186.1 hypothetical protein [Spirochaetota bacterium]
MKKHFLSILVFFICISACVPELFAQSSRKKYFSKPQIGLWYGPVTPIFETSEYLKPDLGGGVFFRYNLPYDPLKIGIDSSYQSYGSEGVNSVTLIPLYGNLLWLLPIDLPIRFQLKAGGGACKVKMQPDDIEQWEPLLMLGTEVSFPAGKLANVALRLDYLCIYEEHMNGGKKNGHFFNAGISLYFNLNL